MSERHGMIWTRTWLSALGLLAGCSEPTPDVAPTPPESPTSASAQAAHTQPASPVRVFDRSFEGPRSGCSLQVRSTFSGDETGTMHYAERVTLRVGTGAPVELVSDIEASTLAPIVQQAHDLGGAFLVLGWASWGGGAQTNSALIVDARGCDGLRLVERLDAVSSRARAGLLVGAGGAAVGVPLYPEAEAAEFVLTVGQRRLSMADLRALPATRADAAAWYAPPGGAGMQRAPSGIDGVWFMAAVDGFHAPSH